MVTNDINSKSKKEKHRITVAKLIDKFQSKGRYAFKKKELLKELPGTDLALEAALRRLNQKGRLIAPRRGFYVIVPIEYQQAGSPPASWFIEALMEYLNQPYYVALLSAAAIHGAAHQQPQFFQVMTNIATRSISVGRLKINFYANNRVEQMPVQNSKTETGYMKVSTPEVTAFDLVRFPKAGGYYSNVATVLTELAESMDATRLYSLARLARTSEIQRLGYLLEQLELGELSKVLHKVFLQRRRRPIYLRPDKKESQIPLDRHWYVIPNEKIEADNI